MKALLDGLKSRFDADGTLTGTFTGGFWIGEAAPRTAMDYLTYDVIAAPDTLKYSSTGNAFYVASIQFTSWSTVAAEALANLETYMATLDGQVITLSSGQNMFSAREHQPIPSPGSPDQDEQGRDVWGWLVTYSFGATT